MLVVERGNEDLRGGQGDVDGLPADVNILRFELSEVDARDGLAVYDQEEAVAGEQVGEDGAGFGAFDDGVDGVDDAFEAADVLDLLNDGRNGGVDGGGAAGDGSGDVAQESGCGVANKDGQEGGAEKKSEEEGKDGSGGAAA